ncbi:MAG: aspartate aminotransferase family protein [Acidobacteria bacterium]|nr:MAG: aspartate aminotransferase family protein [Acidobacteriota bacterium]
MLSGELPVYPRLPFRPVRGEGCLLFDADGRRVIDLYGGHAVALTGHRHPRVVAALRAQLDELLFYSNAVELPARERLVERLVPLAPPGVRGVFLVNSGAEANEQALALARRATGRSAIVACEGAFHGRTLATLAVSGLPRYRALAETSDAGRQLAGRTRLVPWNDADALERAVDDDVAAVIVEPVQGLAGARAASAEFLRRARAACDAAGAVLILDEVQSGCGRTGAFTTAQALGVTPDAITLAKGIAAGLPLGALLVGERLAEGLGPGDLGTTFGGGPLPCAAAAANLDVLVDEDLPARARALEAFVRREAARRPGIRRVQGLGLLLGLVLERPAKAVQAALLERGFLAGTSADPAVLRLLPPLTVGEEHLAAFFAALDAVLAAGGDTR